MFFKMLWMGIKGHFRDYALLLSGLTLSAAVFTMFQSVANNDAMIEQTGSASSFKLAFQLGTIMLAVIIYVYMRYANNFLLELKAKTYGLFMTLGARPSQIARLTFCETILIGLVAGAAGIALGIGGTAVLNHVMMSSLGLSIGDTAAVFVPAGIKVTVIFLLVVFLLVALSNAHKVRRSQLIDLLHADTTPVRDERSNVRVTLESVAGLLLLAVCYYVICNFMKFGSNGLLVILVTLIAGTYFVIHSFSLFAIRALQKNRRFHYHKLNAFLLGQLDFRIRDYTRMLSVVSLLFALAIGALTVGLEFRSNTTEMARIGSDYDLVLNRPDRIDRAKVRALHPTSNVTYTLKEDDGAVYFNKAEIDAHPLSLITNVNPRGEATTKRLKADQIAGDQGAMRAFYGLLTNQQSEKAVKFLPADAFNRLTAPMGQIQLIQVADFTQQLPALKELYQESKASFAAVSTNGQSIFTAVDAGDAPSVSASRISYYVNLDVGMSGFQYMGFFLGIAFLAMLASCLMFKVISGAKADQARYQMLAKLGARRKLLRRAVAREVAILFGIPAVIGIIHMLVGLQMFGIFLLHPYAGIALPMTIFIICYAIYYAVTVVLYRRRVAIG